jgi:hypothetical protein
MGHAMAGEYRSDCNNDVVEPATCSVLPRTCHAISR